MKPISVVLCAVVCLAVIAIVGVIAIGTLSIAGHPIPEGLSLVVATCVSAIAGISPGLQQHSAPGPLTVPNDPPATPAAPTIPGALP
jgi:hypothetical protein